MQSEIPGGITAAEGFQAAGVHCGVKKVKKDLALVLSTVPAEAAGVFTMNRVPAAPVVLDRQVLSAHPRARALVVNSGNANACTGARGMDDARTMAREAASALRIAPEEVLVSSTGVIGQFLPMDRIVRGIQAAAGELAPSGHRPAAEAILTTDTFVKECAVRCRLGEAEVVIGGMAKGSGMIAPNMATMLAFVTTDAAIPAPLLRTALTRTSDRSFNRITVDGDTSTNDMVLLLANGRAGNRAPVDEGDPLFTEFCAALEHVLVRLSKMIVMDGEGATKFVEITVHGACTEADAVRAARAIANSNLVKTAIHGEDANWGRILAAVGYSGIEFDPAAVDIRFGDVPILRPNYTIDFSEEEARRVLSQKEIAIHVGLHQGAASASFWTCDLSREYVTINASYRS